MGVYMGGLIVDLVDAGCAVRCGDQLKLKYRKGEWSVDSRRIFDDNRLKSTGSGIRGCDCCLLLSKRKKEDKGRG